jgi:hypothetical protein
VREVAVPRLVVVEDGVEDDVGKLISDPSMARVLVLAPRCARSRSRGVLHPSELGPGPDVA